MFCNNECINKETEKKCGLHWTSEYEDEKGKKTKIKQCGILAIANELIAIRKLLLGVQQATEGNRNVGDQVGRALTDVFKKGFNKMAKAQLIRDNPAIAIFQDEDE